MLIPLSLDLEINCCVGTACLEIIENRISTNISSKKPYRLYPIMNPKYIVYI